MDTNALISYSKQPSLLVNASIAELEQLIQTYPYFTIGHLLLTKKMQQTQHLLLKKAIKKSAVITPNRKKVYELLYQKEIQDTILESQTQKVAHTIVPPTEKVEEVEEPSSFKTAVEVSSSTENRSTFSQPINLQDLSVQPVDDMDVLEQQIIGQTIEHVLTQEIELNYQPTTPVSKDKKKKPLGVTGKQKFSDWLEILDQSRLESVRNEELESEVNTKFSEQDIINSFLSKNANIISPTKDSVEFSPSNLARLSIVDDENFITETLASIYVKQGNYQKAINAFNKLMLKYPEKKTYFAARIKKIETEQN